MGADLIANWLWATQPVDFEKAREIIRAEIVDSVLDDDSVWDGNFLLRWDPNSQFEDMPVGLSNEEHTPESIREQLLLDTDAIEQLWANEDGARDVLVAVMGPVKVLLAGGTSWGDTPGDSFDMLMRWIDTPAAKAAGFYGGEDNEDA